MAKALGEHPFKLQMAPICGDFDRVENSQLGFNFPKVGIKRTCGISNYHLSLVFGVLFRFKTARTIVAE